MRTTILPASSPDAISRAVDILQSGGLIAFPTDTVYGIGALAFDGPAVVSIYAAKDRPVDKAIPVLLAGSSDLEQVATDIPESAMTLAEHFWPGPLTIIVPKRPGLPEAVSATFSIGVRVPDHEFARRLLHATGPMAVTSANLSGAPSPVTAQEVYDQLGGRVPLILDGGNTPGGVPSTLVDCTTGELKVLREGPLSLDQLTAILNEAN